MAASAICFFKLYLLSPKQVRKLIGSLRRSQNVLPRPFKLCVRPYYDHGHIMRDQA